MMRSAIFLFLISWANVLYATDFYVGGVGASDSNPGSSSQPFQTIQKAAGVAKSGDVVIIRAGTYRETITPANNGVTFQSTEGAVVSGLSPVTGPWTLHSGNIYKTTLNVGPLFTEYMTGFSNNNFQYNNTQMLAQQIFKDGQMQMLASYPKVSSPDQLLDRSSFRSVVNAPNFGPTAITDGGFAPFGNLTGGIVTIQGWFIIATRTITSQNGNTINYGSTGDGGDHAFSKFYRVTGKLGLLTQAKEWHYENNTLYYWQEGGGSPTGVEYKARNWGFDLRGKSNITIVGLQFIACEPVMTTTASANIIIDNIRAKYTSHHLLESKGGNGGYMDSPVQTGMKLFGPGSVLKNSEFNCASGVTVWAGSGVTIQNNKFENGDYGGFYGAFIKLTWSGTEGASNVKILNNTFSRSGRGAIEFMQPGHGMTYSNVEIGYNDFSKFIMVNVDGGAIYGAQKAMLVGSRIHHNWFHNDGGFNEAGTGQQRGIMVNGVYFDQASGPATIDHNVHWNGISGAGRSGGYSSEFYTQIFYHERNEYAIGTSNLYNNTNATATGGGQYSYVTYTKSPHDVQRNNISRAGLVIDWGINGNTGNVANALLMNVTPQFVGSGNGGLAYRLAAGSSAINAGTVINGITDGSVGTPDIGAYEFGGEEWVPGYKAVPQTSVPNAAPKVGLTAPTASASFTQGAAIGLTATATDDDGNVTRVEFYDGATKIGEDLTSPYSFSWTGAAPGTHSLTARATDNRSATATSTAISITVTASANKAPTISLTSPANNSSLGQGTTISISATAADSDGTVAKVEFFDGAAKLGEDTSSPYTFAMANPSVGAHALSARATDNQGAVGNSTTVNITVVATAANKAPVATITAPANNTSLASGTAVTVTATATDSDGTVAKVEFFDGTTKLGEDTSSPYTYSWTKPAVGAHGITAKATDNGGLSASSALVNIVVTAPNTPVPTPDPVPVPNNVSPAVALTAPTVGTSFTAGADINFAASASDSDGSIVLVEFFEGTNKVGEDDSAPYSATWAPTIEGGYTITAVATDDKGATNVSTAVQITVTNFGPGGEATDIYSEIPRFFSPNGDGNGDTWTWSDDPRLANASVEVRNRAGELVYQSSAYNNSWDGKSGGKALQDGDYFYIVRLTDLTVLRASVRIIR